MSNFEFAELQSIRNLLGLDIEILKFWLGGNSKIFLVRTEEQIVIAKKYTGDINRRVKSMNREIMALNFLRQSGFRQVPELLDHAQKDLIVIMEYVEGLHPESNYTSMMEIIDFLKQLKFVYDKDSSFPTAIDSIDTTADLLDQIHVRLSRLETQLNKNELLAEAQNSFSQFKSMNFTARASGKTYSVSDLGIHNMIQNGNRAKFLDLEFFGSDSPTKVIGDFLLHPRNSFSSDLKLQLLLEMTSFFRIPKSAIEEYLPLAALKWALIVMRRLGSEMALPTENSFMEVEALARNYISMSRLKGEDLLAHTVY